jgi:hypothetical protein
MNDSDAETESNAVPDWSDPYIDRISDRLMFNYDLEKEFSISGERFDLYGKLDVHSQKQFFHPALSYGHHEMAEHLFARRVDSVRVADLEALVSLGHELADLWITPDDSHFSTEFSFALVTDSIPDEVHEFVSGFLDRTLLKYGYHGHYEINLVVLAPDREEFVASENADVATAFVLWNEIEETRPGFTVRLLRRLFG